MPLFGKSQDKATEERLEALLARREARRSSQSKPESKPGGSPSPSLSRRRSSGTQAAPASRTSLPNTTSTIASRAVSSSASPTATHSGDSGTQRQHVAANNSSVSETSISGRKHHPVSISSSLPSLNESSNAPKQVLPAFEPVAEEMPADRSVQDSSAPKARFFWNRSKAKTSTGSLGLGRSRKVSVTSVDTGSAAGSVSNSPRNSPSSSPSQWRHSASGPRKKSTYSACSMPHCSRLNVELLEILSQHAALPYFLQYAEPADCLTMVQFWMAVESFRVSSFRRIQRYQGTSPRGSTADVASCGLTSSNSSLGSSGTVASSILRHAKAGLTADNAGKNSSSPSALSPSQPSSDGKAPNATQRRSSSATSSPSAYHRVLPSGNHCSKTNSPANGPVDEGGGRHDNSLPSPRRPPTLTAKDFPPLHKSAMLEFKDNPLSLHHSLSIQRDALALYKQYVSMQARTPINIPIEQRQDIELGICREDGFVSPDVFSEAQKTVFELLDKHYFQPFLKSHFYCKFVIEVLTSMTLRLADIMLGDVSAMVFTEFMEQEKGLDLFHFWTLANSFQLDLKDQLAQGTYVGSRALEDAMAVYDRYFSLQATCPLRLGDEVRVAVEMSICREDVDGPQADCFSQSMHVVYSIMEEDFLSDFLTSNLYLGFLSKLVNSVGEHRRADHESLKMQKAESSEGLDRSQSNTSVDRQLYTQASAQASLSAANVRSHFAQEALGIDCGEDPDALWRRSKLPLNFGRVTEMGDYVSDLLPYPDAKDVKASIRVRMSHAVQKMMNTYMEDSEKREMASRVARMIVTKVLQQTGHTDAWILQAGCYDDRITPEMGVVAAGDPVL